MNKSPAFQLYSQDFISSLDVQMMSAAEVGAYCLLLFNSWCQPNQCYLPNDEAQLQFMSRLTAEQWKESRKKLLAKFVLTADKKHRFNPRLLSELEKQNAFRLKQSEKGAKGGRPKKPEESHGKPTALPQLNHGKADVKPDESPSSSISSSTTPDGVVPPPPKKKNQVYADEAEVFTLAGFAAFVEKIGYGRIDKGRYLPQIQNATAEGEQRDEKGWGKFITYFLNKEVENNRLMLADAGNLPPKTFNVDDLYNNPNAYTEPPPALTS